MNIPMLVHVNVSRNPRQVVGLLVLEWSATIQPILGHKGSLTCFVHEGMLGWPIAKVFEGVPSLQCNVQWCNYIVM